MDFRVDKKNLSKHLIIIILSFLLFTSIILIYAFSGLSQSTDIYITIDQDFQKADFTVDEVQTIHVTGNITIDTDSAAANVYFGIYAPEGWETTISPEEYTATFGFNSISFEGTITPQKEQCEQEAYNVYIWASVEDKNPSELDIISSTSNVFSERSIIEVILNRVMMISDATDQRILPDSILTHTFTVTNVGTVTDLFFIDLIDDERLKNEGWTVTQSAFTLTLDPGETNTFTVEQQVPEDAKVGDYELQVIVSSEGDAASKSSQTLITKVRVPNVEEPFNFLPFLFIAFIGMGISLGAFFAATEIGYLAILSLFLPLYVRLKKKDVLSHFTRGQIFGYIQANPGAHYNSIIQYLDLHNGVGAYHLKVLEREGYIKSFRDGIYKRFYPKNMRIPEKRLHLSRIQRDILTEIQKHPGIAQKQIAKLLDESKQVINYNVKILENATLIRVERYGRETACFAGNVRYVQDDDVYEVSDEPVSAHAMKM